MTRIRIPTFFLSSVYDGAQEMVQVRQRKEDLSKYGRTGQAGRAWITNLLA